MTKAPTDYHKEERCLLVHSFREISVRHGGGKMVTGQLSMVMGIHGWCLFMSDQPEGRQMELSHGGHNLQSPIRPMSTFLVPPPGVSQPSLQYHRLRINHSKCETIGVFQIQTITEHQPVTQCSHASWDPCIIHHVGSMDHDQVPRSTKQLAAMVSSTKEVKRGWERIVGRGGGIILQGRGPEKFPEYINRRMWKSGPWKTFHSRQSEHLKCRALIGERLWCVPGTAGQSSRTWTSDPWDRKPTERILRSLPQGF